MPLSVVGLRVARGFWAMRASGRAMRQRRFCCTTVRPKPHEPEERAGTVRSHGRRGRYGGGRHDRERMREPPPAGAGRRWSPNYHPQGRCRARERSTAEPMGGPRLPSSLPRRDPREVSRGYAVVLSTRWTDNLDDEVEAKSLASGRWLRSGSDGGAVLPQRPVPSASTPDREMNLDDDRMGMTGFEAKAQRGAAFAADGRLRFLLSARRPAGRRLCLRPRHRQRLKSSDIDIG